MKKYKLLEKAMRDYPAGTHLHNGCITSGVYKIDNEGDILNMELVSGEWRINRCVYYQQVWAPILKINKKQRHEIEGHSLHKGFEYITFRGPRGSGKTNNLERYLDKVIRRNGESGLQTMVERLDSCSNLKNYNINTRIPYSRKHFDCIIFVVDGCEGDFEKFALMVSECSNIPVLLLQTVLTK